MGFFGKNKTALPAAATTGTTAPAAATGQSSITGNYVAPPETPGPALSVALSKGAESKAGSKAGSNASTVKTKQTTTIDLEKGSVAASKTNSVAPVPIARSVNTYSPIFEDNDETTVGSKTFQTYDDRTFKTEYTAPTLRTIRSEDEQSKDSAFTITRNGEYLTMNGFANGHLMRWKFAAEEGPAFIRFPAVLLALAVIGTTVYPIVINNFLWNASTIICATHTCITASLILVLEGRVVLGYRAPTNFRARVRAVITRYLNLFRLLWGRGLLYIFVGTMNMTIDHPFALYTGIALCSFGLVAIASGAHASYNLDKMKTSLTDEAYLWSKFDGLDSDSDNLIDLNEFAELLWTLGLEFDDAYTFKAFSQIEGDATAKISFEQFRDWWIVTQHKGRMLKNSNL